MTGFDVNRLIAARSQHGKEIKPSKSLFAGHRIEEGVGQRYNVRSESDDVVVYPPGIEFFLGDVCTGPREQGHGSIRFQGT